MAKRFIEVEVSRPQTSVVYLAVDDEMQDWKDGLRPKLSPADLAAFHTLGQEPVCASKLWSPIEAVLERAADKTLTGWDEWQDAPDNSEIEIITFKLVPQKDATQYSVYDVNTRAVYEKPASGEEEQEATRRPCEHTLPLALETSS